MVAHGPLYNNTDGQNLVSYSFKTSSLIGGSPICDIHMSEFDETHQETFHRFMQFTKKAIFGGRRWCFVGLLHIKSTQL